MSSRLSKADQIYIRENLDKKSIQEIAKKLMKPVNVVDNWIQTQKKTEPKKATPETLEVIVKEELRNTLAWKKLKQEFTLEELRYFEEEYGKYLKQFNANQGIEATEDSQLFQLIKIDLLMARNLKDQKDLRDEIKFMEEQLKEFLRAVASSGVVGEETRQQIKDIKQHIAGCQASLNTLNKDYMGLIGEHKLIMKDLKGTRNQRIKELEDKNISWLGLIKEMEDSEVREREGTQLALVKKAVEKEHKRLSRPHKYADGNMDLPILSAETVEQLEKKEM